MRTRCYHVITGLALPVILSVLALANYSCNENGKAGTNGGELAKTYCGSCHSLPSPALLDKSSWRRHIMPVMARKLGWDYIYETPVKDSQPVLSFAELRRIAEWYYQYAPDSALPQPRSRVEKMSALFKAATISVRQGQYPSTAFIKIDPGNRLLYATNASDSSIHVFDKSLNLLGTGPAKGTVIDISFFDSLSRAGTRAGVLTYIGTMNPNDRKEGFVQSFSAATPGLFKMGGVLFDSLPRPVQTIPTDLDQDGITDFVVCGFGNNQGGLSWHSPHSTKPYTQQLIRNIPGAIRSYAGDFDQDGRPDLLVLMAQAQEGIYLFSREPNGSFASKTVLEFPVIYGSSYFELADFNGDGHEDILYTCGDNADYTGDVLKNYHGVYIYLNDGKFRFTRQYFFAVHGCYKAMARDFDKDGDLDIATISFFPDNEQQPQESFIYLEQTGPLQFEPYGISEHGSGRWLTMDAEDIDGDGDIDIALGSLIPPYPDQLEDWKKENKKKAAVMLLRNRTAGD